MLADCLRRLTPYCMQQEFTGDFDAHMARMSQDMMRARREASLDRCQQLETERKCVEQQDDELALIVRAAVVAAELGQQIDDHTAASKGFGKSLLPVGQAVLRRLVERAEANDGAAREELKKLLRGHRSIWQPLAAMVKTIQEQLLDKVIGRENELRHNASRLLTDGRSQLQRHPGNAVETIALERVMLVQVRIWALELTYTGNVQLSDEEATAVARSKESAANRQKSAFESLAALHKAVSVAKPTKRRKQLVIRSTSQTA